MTLNTDYCTHIVLQYKYYHISGRALTAAINALYVIMLVTYVLCRNDLAELKYLTMCIKESMRLHCPVPFIQRQTVNEITVDGVTLPPRSLIDIQIYNLHHNQLVWEEPMVRIIVLMQLQGPHLTTIPSSITSIELYIYIERERYGRLCSFRDTNRINK